MSERSLHRLSIILDVYMEVLNKRDLEDPDYLRSELIKVFKNENYNLTKDDYNYFKVTYKDGEEVIAYVCFFHCPEKMIWYVTNPEGDKTSRTYVYENNGLSARDNNNNLLGWLIEPKEGNF